MAFIRAQNWKERLDQLQALKDKCNQIIGSLGIPQEREKEDVRTLAIIQVRQFCNTLALAPIILHVQYEKSKGNDIQKVFCLPNDEALKSFLGDLKKNCKASFVTMAQFALENSIERVLDSIPNQKGCRNFSSSSKQLLQVAGINDTKHDILMVPARIRNSLHGAGIYNGPSKCVDICGEQYVFTKGQRVSCVTWSHVFHAFCNCLDIYREMLSSPEVKEVDHIPAE